MKKHIQFFLLVFSILPAMAFSQTTITIGNATLKIPAQWSRTVIPTRPYILVSYMPNGNDGGDGIMFNTQDTSISSAFSLAKTYADEIYSPKQSVDPIKNDSSKTGKLGNVFWRNLNEIDTVKHDTITTARFYFANNGQTRIAFLVFASENIYAEGMFRDVTSMFTSWANTTSIHRLLRQNLMTPKSILKVDANGRSFEHLSKNNISPYFEYLRN